MANPTLLYFALSLLFIDSIIEFACVTTMVSWLHRTAGGEFTFHHADLHNGDVLYSIHGKPANLLVNQGHTSNGAAGTALVLICIGGAIVLSLRAKPRLWQTPPVKILYHIWLVLTVLSALLSLTALIYTNILTSKYSGQQIDLLLATTLHNRPYPNQVPYPLDTWTPQNWFAAVLELPLVDSADDIAAHLKIMNAWRWNLIPLFLIGVVVAVLAFLDAFNRRGEMRWAREMLPTQEDDKGRMTVTEY